MVPISVALNSAGLDINASGLVTIDGSGITLGSANPSQLHVAAYQCKRIDSSASVDIDANNC